MAMCCRSGKKYLRMFRRQTAWLMYGSEEEIQVQRPSFAMLRYSTLRYIAQPRFCPLLYSACSVLTTLHRPPSRLPSCCSCPVFLPPCPFQFKTSLARTTHSPLGAILVASSANKFLSSFAVSFYLISNFLMPDLH